MEYIYSKKEFNRRKTAFSSLSASLIVGTFTSSLILDFHISYIVYICIAAVLILLCLSFFRFFDHLLCGRIMLSDNEIMRITRKSSDSMLITDITKIKVKRTVKGTVREICIRANNGRSMSFNALNDPDIFTKELMDKTNKTAVVREIHEPLDFDHPLFYPVLGVLLSFITISLFKVLTGSGYAALKPFMMIVSAYASLLGIYLALAKPMSKSYGSRSKAADLATGSILILLGIYIFITGI